MGRFVYVSLFLGLLLVAGEAPSQTKLQQQLKLRADQARSLANGDFTTANGKFGDTYVKLGTLTSKTADLIARYKKVKDNMPAGSRQTVEKWLKEAISLNNAHLKLLAKPGDIASNGTVYDRVQTAKKNLDAAEKAYVAQQWEAATTSYGSCTSDAKASSRTLDAITKDLDKILSLSGVAEFIIEAYESCGGDSFVLAQDCPPPIMPTEDDFQEDYVDPLIQSVKMFYMMDEMGVAPMVIGQQSAGLARLATLRASLTANQGKLTQDQYDLVDGLLQEADADLRVSGESCANMSANMQSADINIAFAELAYVTDDFESSYALVADAIGEVESVFDAMGSFEDCITSAQGRMDQVANILLSTQFPMMPLQPIIPMMPPPTPPPMLPPTYPMMPPLTQ